MTNCVDHRWLLVPGGEVNGIMKLGCWVCVNCGFKGPSSRFKCPGKDFFKQEDEISPEEQATPTEKEILKSLEGVE